MKNPIQLRYGLSLLVLIFVLGKGVAQTFSGVAATANGSTNNLSANPLPANLLLDPINQYAFNTLTPGLLGINLGAVCCSRSVMKGDQSFPNRVASYGGSRIFISGDGTQHLI